MNATVEYLRDAAKYGPKNGPVAPNLRGWRTPDGHFICAHCAGRVVNRGCQLPKGSEAVWADQPEKIGVCCVCSEVHP